MGKVKLGMSLRLSENRGSVFFSRHGRALNYMNFSFDRLTDNRYYSRPMKDPMPHYIDPIRLANRFEHLCGIMSVKDMNRLNPMLASSEGDVDIDLELSVDQFKIRNIKGQIRTKIKLVCQRCLQTMDYVVEVRVMLGIIKQREQADRLPQMYEPLLVESDEISLLELIEDELLLAMPITPRHDLTKDKKVCDMFYTHFYTHNNTVDNVSNDINNDNSASEGHAKESKRKNPFAVLAQLKVKNKKNHD